MNNPSPKVEGYLRKHKHWHDLLSGLRALALESGLTEDFKWRNPVYTLNGKNVLILGAFKEGCVLSFLQGALLNDPHNLLTKPGPNTRAARVARFTTAEELTRATPAIKALIQEAIRIEQQGLKVKLDPGDFTLPSELESAFARTPKLRTAFTRLTPGRQRAYVLHFASAKQSKTRESRIQKCTPMILAGKGLMDD